MKKKLFVIFLLACLGGAVVACGEDEKVVDDKPVEVATEDQVPKELEVQEPDELQEFQEEQAKEGKEGIDAIDAMGLERPSKLKIVSEITVLGSTTIMTSYYDEENSRTEIDIPGMEKSILISIPSEEVLYQYVYGESTGIKVINAYDSSAEDMGMILDMSIVNQVLNNSTEGIIVREETLDEFNGEKVIYIESTEIEEGMGEMLVKMWYSKKYVTPLKYEVYIGGTLTTQMKVTEISDNVNFDADTFVPPTDIQFQETEAGFMNGMNW